MVVAINNNAVNSFDNLAIPLDQAYAQQGKLYYDSGHFTGAWNCFNEAIKINPNEQYYYYMRAACSANLGNYNAAIADYNKALTVANNNEQKGWIHFDMAILYAGIGDENTAKHHLITAAKLGHGIARDVCNQNGIPY